MIGRGRAAAKVAAADAQREIEDVRATYHASGTVARDEVVTIRGIDPAGRAAIVTLRLLTAAARVVVDLIAPAPETAFIATPVSKHVNSVKNDDPACVLPVDLATKGSARRSF